VTLPPFDLHRTSTVDEASELLRRYGEDAAVHCGGTELLLLLKLGFASYGHLVDIKPIHELKGIAAENGALKIGASVTHREIERSPIVADTLPALAAMERRVANLRVRSIGTLGGNLCFSDPHSDPAGFLLALDAEVECRSGASDGRRLPLSEFLLGPYQTALRPAELLTGVCIPLPAAGTAVVHDKISFHERPAATITVAVREEAGVYADVRIAVGSVGPRPVRAREAEQILAGSDASDESTLERAAEAAALASGPVEDSNGSEVYKANLVQVLVKRSVARALHGRTADDKRERQ
jgi:aerobic carbon-monoxide dehydrogenase medium subunit